jgi:hypothetical protein
MQQLQFRDNGNRHVWDRRDVGAGEGRGSRGGEWSSAAAAQEAIKEKAAQLEAVCANLKAQPALVLRSFLHKDPHELERVKQNYQG